VGAVWLEVIMHKLTPSQIRHSDEIRADELANNQTLEIALQFHSNRANENTKRWEQFWKEMAELHGLDLDQKIYNIIRIEGTPTIVEVKEKTT
jgi:hypothetical protein